jgi:hypothetical protein
MHDPSYTWSPSNGTLAVSQRMQGLPAMSVSLFQTLQNKQEVDGDNGLDNGGFGVPLSLTDYKGWSLSLASDCIQPLCMLCGS